MAARHHQKNHPWYFGHINLAVSDSFSPRNQCFSIPHGQSKTAGSKTAGWGHTGACPQSCHGCVSATFVWDHCEGHLLDMGREKEVIRWTLCGLNDWLNYRFIGEQGYWDTWWFPRFVTVQHVVSRVSAIKEFLALLLCSWHESLVWNSPRVRWVVGALGRYQTLV